MMLSMVVVLPGAVAPDQADHLLRRRRVSDTPLQDVGGAAEGVDRIDLEQHDPSFRCEGVGPESRAGSLATCSFVLISSGVPSARIAPWCITTMRSE